MTHWITLIALGFTGLIAGIIDTLAGGGGLICVPALLSAGLSPAVTLGTNKLQSCVGELNATLHFLRKKKIDLKQMVMALIITAISATTGAICIQLIHPDILGKLLPFLLLVVLIYTIFSPKAREVDGKAKLSWRHFSLIFGVLIGFYNGFFGPPTGSLWMFSLMFFAGMNIVNATMHTKPLNFIGNVTSVIPFILVGNINYPAAIAMAIGQLIGSHIGAGLVIHRGHRLIKPFYIIMVSIMLIDVFIKAYAPGLQAYLALP
ncbi:MAG: TSUP family transporter [Coxiellaceae bacterium]|nr:TSUP family transporter [Coxiellaceae bacterium]